MRALLLLLAIPGCDAAIALELRLPKPAEIPAEFDLSCVTAVDVKAISADRQQLDLGDFGKVPCIPVTGLQSFAQLPGKLADRFETPIPASELLGFQLRGRVGSCDYDPELEDNYHEAIFYGGAPYLGDDDILIPVIPNISCNRTRSYKVRPFDLLATIATKTCTNLTTGFAYAAQLRPTLLAPKLPSMMYEAGTGGAELVDGVATFPSFIESDPAGCIAAGFETADLLSVSCLEPAAARLCALDGELDLPTGLDRVWFDTLDPDLQREFGPPTFVSVWDNPVAPGVKAPVANASIRLPDGERGMVVYLDVVGGQPGPRSGTTTGPSGLAAVYATRLTEVTITAQRGSRKLRVAGAANGPSMAIAVMP